MALADVNALAQHAQDAMEVEEGGRERTRVARR